MSGARPDEHLAVSSSPVLPGDRAAALHSAVDVVVTAVDRWGAASTGVIVVALDGHGAAGKSTLADSVRLATRASVIHTDDFFVPAGRGTPPAGRETPEPTPENLVAAPVGVAALPGTAGVAGAAVPEARRALGSYFDVIRLRGEALEPLRAGKEAVYRAFDWSSGTLSPDERRVGPNDLVLLEGVYSSAPELADLVDYAIFVETPEPERLRRLRGRIAPEDWDSEWLEAEKAYFAGPRPPRSFDLTVPGAVPPAPRVAHAPAGPRRVGDFEQQAHRR